ncbi:MAG: hypothetical protein U5P10_16330, partial [Spirochaetia bacterium]|nr:hypothetical protein [Spirochaetia bacterium]
MFRDIVRSRLAQLLNRYKASFVDILVRDQGFAIFVYAYSNSDVQEIATCVGSTLVDIVKELGDFPSVGSSQVHKILTEAHFAWEEASIALNYRFFHSHPLAFYATIPEPTKLDSIEIIAAIRDVEHTFKLDRNEARVRTQTLLSSVVSASINISFIRNLLYSIVISLYELSFEEIGYLPGNVQNLDEIT